MRIRLVESASDLRAFVALPYRLHRDDPNWVAPLRREVRTRLSPAKNPFFRHSEADCFLAEREGRVVGRIAAIANRRHDERYGDGAAFFGFFDCLDDERVATALFDTAAAWARDRGYERLRGPASLSTNDECGLLVDGFDRPPTLMTPHNPPSYPRLVQAAGFEKTKDLLAWEAGDPARRTPVPERLARSIETLRRRSGIELRGVNRRDFWGEVGRLHVGYNLMWERNWGFVPMSDEEFRHMASQLRPIFVPEIGAFAEKDGEALGVVLGIPDVNQILCRHRSGRLLPAALHVLWSVRRQRITRMRVVILGVQRAYHGRAVDAMLYHRVWSHALDRGMRWAEASWILEDNLPMNNALERLGLRHYKTWRLYDRRL